MVAPHSAIVNERNGKRRILFYKIPIVLQNNRWRNDVTHYPAQIELETGEEYDYEKGGVKKKNLRSELTELVVFLN